MKPKRFTLSLIVLLWTGMLLQAQPSLSCFGLSLNSDNGQPGETVCLDVTTQGFASVMGLQFSIQWDPAVLTFSEVSNFNLPGMAMNNFGITPELINQGRLSVAWFDAELTGVTLGDGSPLFSVCFELSGTTGQRSEVTFDMEPTPAEITLSDFSLVENYGLFGGSVGITADGTGAGLPTLSGCLDEFDCATGQGTYTASTGGADPGDYTYVWTNANGTTVSTAIQLTNAGTGDYALSLSSSAGETISARVTLGNLAGFDLQNVNITPANCSVSSSGAIDLTLPSAQGGYAFQWSNGATTEDLTGLVPGTYNVTITLLPSGCTLNETFEVSAVDFLVGYSNECQIFGSDSASVTVTAVVWAGGAPPYTFEWSNGTTTTSDFSGAAVFEHPSDYSLTVTDQNGCQYFSAVQSTVCAGFPNDDAVRLIIGNYNVAPGESLCVPVQVSNFDQVKDLQFSLAWDPEVLTFDSLSGPVFLVDWSTTFFTDQANDGIIGFTGIAPADDAFGLNLPNGTAIFELCFTADDVSGFSALTFVNTPIAVTVFSNDEWQNPELDHGQVLVTNGSDGNMILSLPNVTGEVGQPVCLPVFADVFQGMGGLQHTLSWDPEILVFDTLYSLELEGVNQHVADYSLMDGIDEGNLRVLWLDADLQTVTLPDQSPLYSVCFTPLTPGYSPVAVTGTLIPMEAYQGDLTPVNVISIAGSVVIDDNLVWPGDTDNNNIVNHYDLLNIGLAYGAPGPVRNGASLDWNGQPAELWDQATPASDVNFRHIDTNGDGQIDTADTLAISLNWEQVADFAMNDDPVDGLGLNDPSNTLLNTGAPLYVLPDTLLTGQVVSFPVILGEADWPAQEVYGLAFTIVYDTELVDENTVWASFPASWLGQPGSDLLTFYRNDPDNGQLHIALTRTDGWNSSGYGAIAHFNLTIEDVIFKRDDFELSLGIKNPRLLSFNEALIPVTEINTITIIEDNSTSTRNNELEKQVRLYPVPARQELFLQAPAGWINQVELFNAEGQRMLRSGPVDRLDLQAMQSGAYFIRITTPEGVISKRIVIIKN